MKFNEEKFIDLLTKEDEQKTIGEVLLDSLGIVGMELTSETEFKVDARLTVLCLKVVWKS